MEQKENPYAYRRIRANKKYEVEMVGLLMRSGQKFSAVSETDYLVSNRQCNKLTKNKIPYTKI